MTLYETLNFPMLNSNNETVIISNLAPNVAVSADGKTYAERIVLNDCKEVELGYVRPPTTIMLVEANPSCTIDSLNGRPQGHCWNEAVNITHVLSGRMGHVCYLFVPQAEWAQLKCHDMIYTMEEPKYVELRWAYVLHGPCSLIGPSFSVGLYGMPL